MRKLSILLLILLFCSLNAYTQSVNMDAIFKPNKQKAQKVDKTKEKTKINIALLLPLYYEDVDELSFNQYNIDEKRSYNYKCFSYINFYEGVRIALDKFEKQGYNISLYVFDVGENDLKKMQKALDYQQMKQMDMIIPLVFKQSFDLVSKFALDNKIPIINPMSPSKEILANPYVIKIQPDAMAMSSSLIKYILSRNNKHKILVIFDDKYSQSEVVNYWKNELPKVTDKWTILNYRKSASKINQYVDKQSKTIVINLIDKGNEKDNKQYCNQLVNTLLSCKTDITLFSYYNWLEYVGNDYKKLQDLNFHFALSYYNDYTNNNFVEFVRQYRNNFKGEPDKIYASLAYDIITYFVPLIKQKGKDFISNPNTKDKNDMINRYHFIRESSQYGWQNSNATIYKMENYKIKSEWSF